jgi:hypothetical protein
MSLTKGNFKVVCDEPGCDEEVDLETDNFQEAVSVKFEMTPGWGHYGGGRGFRDYCPAHDTKG